MALIHFSQCPEETMTAFLETDRLLLRQFTEDDADLLFALDSDPDVMRHVGPYGLPDSEAYRQHIRKNFLPYYAKYEGYGFWAVIEKAGGAFIGWLTLRPALDYRFAREADFGPEDFELGYRLRKAAWGKGYATEAARALVRKAFTELGMTRVVAAALATNLASIRVMEKVGLEQVGQFILPGYDPPAVKYALSREEFAARAAAVS